ncbi:RagB/SusD family nutrient uptake outer membrane protein [uncultured Chitinophaga sp.]|uniref:RagB/SusD family nutrient uptake outer membrane protein n=1 Tax=uncultured Chitinophaga sp. TaxID=339340 RepID=UPI0025F0F80F|nr:RagB/SusD family nutrient uptake outer membrane protein [uncultured Chitinophaga sp.]
MKRISVLFISLGLIAFGLGCGREKDFLDTKPNEVLFTISSLNDCRTLLNNESVFNNNDVAFTTVSADEFYVTDDEWANCPSAERNSYVWAKDLFSIQDIVFDWGDGYRRIYYSNAILDALPGFKDDPLGDAEFDRIKGSALFFRAYSYYSLAQIFTLPYDAATAVSLPGLPLRLNANFNEKVDRSTIMQTYIQIIADLEAAESMLPATSDFPTLPNKVAAKAMLARVYLTMGDFANAWKYADETLMAKNSIFDYNKLVIPTTNFLTVNSQYPLSEDIFHIVQSGTNISRTRAAIVDSTLYKQYDVNDLRKTAFFQTTGGQIRFKGSYEFKLINFRFSGLATDEILLIRAECNARLARVGDAMTDLNKLLINRFKTGFFVPLTAGDEETALKLILNERKKELIFRGTRWADLRRLGKDPRFATSISRTVKGTVYTLPVGDKRYALSIPLMEVQLTGVAQNDR